MIWPLIMETRTPRRLEGSKPVLFNLAAGQGAFEWQAETGIRPVAVRWFCRIILVLVSAPASARLGRLRRAADRARVNPVEVVTAFLRGRAVFGRQREEIS